MALIFKVAEEQDLPMWYSNDASNVSKDSVSEEEAIRVASLPKEIDDERLGKELDLIEARGSSGETYHYSSSWSDEAKSTIREFSILSNCKALEVDTSNEDLQAFASITKKEGLQKMASVDVQESPLAALKDSFLIDAKFSDKTESKADSEWAKGQEKARSGMPSVEAKGVTIARASSSLDDDNAGIGMRSGIGRNVIQDPNSIGRSIESKDEDVGVRLRRERDEREQAKIAVRKAEQKAKAREIEAAGYGAADVGNFRLTEAVEVQGKVLGKLSRNIETTDGEKISMRHAAKAKAVEVKKAAAKKQWNYLQGASKPSVSDDFANALKTELGKIQ